MKNKSSNRRAGLSYFFRQRTHGKMDTSDTRPELVKPETDQKRTEIVLEGILRWADDGGQMLDIGNPVHPANSDRAGQEANE